MNLTQSMVGKTLYACTFYLWGKHKTKSFGVVDRAEAPHLCQAEVVSVEGTGESQKIHLRPINFVVAGEGELHPVRKCESWSESPKQVVLQRARQICQWVAMGFGERRPELLSIIGEPKSVERTSTSEQVETNVFREHLQAIYAYEDPMILASRIEKYKKPILADGLYQYLIRRLGGWDYESNFSECAKPQFSLRNCDVATFKHNLRDDFGVVDEPEGFIKKGSESICRLLDLHKWLRSKGVGWKVVVNNGMLDMNPTEVIVNSAKSVKGAEWFRDGSAGYELRVRN